MVQCPAPYWTSVKIEFNYHMKDSFITRISRIFTERSKFTFLLAVSLLFLGYFSYSSFLRREGFPVINIPVVIVNTPYFSGDAGVTESSITTPLFNEIKGVEGVTDITTTSTASFSSLVVSFNTEVTSPEIVKSDIESLIIERGISENSSVIVPNASFIDGQNDLVFSLYSVDGTDHIEDLQIKAQIIRDELQKSTLIKQVNVKDQISDELNVITGGTERLQTSFSRVGVREDGELVVRDALAVGVVKKDNEIGAIEFSDEVQKVVKEVLTREEFNKVNVVFAGDPAISLKSQLSSLESNAIAAIVTIFVILLLTINIRSAIILSIFIPLTLASVFIIFAFMGYTLNTISLFALILVLGLFVDDGTIVVEAIDYYKRKGFKGWEAVRRAVNDIGIADISGTLTTVLVFFPLVTVTGILGDFIRVLPITVITALVTSLIIALTILPFLSNLLLRDSVYAKTSLFNRISDFVPSLLLRLGEFGEINVRKVLSKNVYRMMLLIGTILVIIGGSFWASKLKFSFFAPAKDSDIIALSFTFPQSTTASNSRDLSVQVENVIIEKYGNSIEQIVYFAGDNRSAVVQLTLKDMNERAITAPEISSGINDLATIIPGAVVSSSIISAGPPTSQYPFAMQVYTESNERLSQTTNEIDTLLTGTELESGVSVEDVQVAYVNDIRTLNGERYAEISAKLSDNTNSAALLELQQYIESEYDTPDTVQLGFDFGQETENAESFSSVAIAGVIALLVMYLLLVLQFNSFSQPLLILLAIPFSFPGLFLGLYLTGNPMSFFVIVGMTGLIGIVVNNTIMLVEYANARRRVGKNVIDAIAEAVKLRTRPIIATSLTTIAGLLPLALTEPFWESLALTIVFGLISSVILIITSFSVFYYAFEKTRENVYKKLGISL